MDPSELKRLWREINALKRRVILLEDALRKLQDRTDPPAVAAIRERRGQRGVA